MMMFYPAKSKNAGNDLISVGFCQITVGYVDIGSIIKNAQQGKGEQNATSATLHPPGKAIEGKNQHKL